MATRIPVSEATRKRLLKLKLEEGAPTFDDLLAKLLAQYRRTKFLDASILFRRRVEANLRPEFVQEVQRIRKGPFRKVQKVRDLPK